MIGNQRNHPLIEWVDDAGFKYFPYPQKYLNCLNPQKLIIILELNHGRWFSWMLMLNICCAVEINIRSLLLCYDPGRSGFCPRTWFDSTKVRGTTWGNLQERECDVGEENSGKLLPDAIKCIPMFFNPVAKSGFFLLPTSIGADFFEPSTVSQIKGNCKCHCGESSEPKIPPKRPGTRSQPITSSKRFYRSKTNINSHCPTRTLKTKWFIHCPLPDRCG